MLMLVLHVSITCSLLLPILYLWRHFTSSVRHLNGPASPSFWRGCNLGQIYSRDGWAFHRNIVEKHGGAVKIHGFLGCHQIYVSDPKALYHILVKDASIYEETSWFLEGNMLVFGPGLLSTTGDHHRKQRKLLNPAFSVKNMRNLTPIFNAVVRKLSDAIMLQTKEGAVEIDMLLWMSRAALEIVGIGGLGTSIDSLSPDSNSITTYGKSIKNLIPCAFRLSMFRFSIPLLVKLVPAGLRRLLLEIAPSQDLQNVKNIVDVMTSTSDGIYRQKLASLGNGKETDLPQIGEGKDIMSILLKANTLASVNDRLPESQLIAQMSTFMFAGHDTTSSALSQILYCLASHQEEQERLRCEIVSSGIVGGEEVVYDDLMALPYLDAVCRETLRVHPPINFMARTACKDAILPLGMPCKSTDGLSEIDHLCIRKGQNLIVAFGSTNRLKAVWGEDAYEWKPERWLKPLPKSVADAHIAGIYSSLMTFSAGPRSCIGFKYAELEMKIILAVLLKSFKFELPDGKNIIWHLGGIQTPNVSGEESQTPHMPLRVSRVLSPSEGLESRLAHCRAP
ncbi:cytochrome P450 [Phellopilus nigrolimitatus]|nr:cytochrome P450 [Phellopilus nigrolimitatus]